MPRAAVVVLLVAWLVGVARGSNPDADPVVVQLYADAFGLQSQGKFEDALVLFERLLGRAPLYSPALLNAGLAHGAVGRLDTALRLVIEALLQAEHKHPPRSDVIRAAWEWLLYTASSTEAVYNHPVLLGEAQRRGDALKARCRHVPVSVTMHTDGNVGRMSPGTVTSVLEAVQASPSCTCGDHGPKALMLLGMLCQRKDDVAAALEAYGAVLMCTEASQQQRLAAMKNSAAMFLIGQLPAVAAVMYRAMLDLVALADVDDPSHALLWTQAARETFQWAGFDDVVAELVSWLKDVPRRRLRAPWSPACGLVQPLLFLDVPVQLLSDTAKLCAGTQRHDMLTTMERPASHPQVHTLAVAVMSADFRTHPSATLSRGLLQHMDRRAAAVYAYFPYRFAGLLSSTAGLDVHAITGGAPVAETLVDLRTPLIHGTVREAQAAGLPLFTPVNGTAFASTCSWPHPTVRAAAAADAFFAGEHVLDHTIAKHMMDRGVDVLVDMTVNMAMSRQKVAATRAVPIVVNYLGFPGPAGGPPLADYAIVDRFVQPLEVARSGFPESLIVVRGTYQANDQPLDAPLCGGGSGGHDWPRRRAARAAIGLPTDPHTVVLGNLDSGRKFDPVMWQLWMSVMRRVPSAVLWLRTMDTNRRQRLLALAAAAGVAPARLFFQSYSRWTQPRTYFHAYCAMDLWLDTLWCSAHSTATDVLWSGVPMVALNGAPFHSRVSAAFLRVLGAGVLVTHSLTAYEDVAVWLARRPAVLARVRDELVAAAPSNALFNQHATANNVLHGLQAAWDVKVSQQVQHGKGQWHALHIVQSSTARHHDAGRRVAAAVQTLQRLRAVNMTAVASALAALGHTAGEVPDVDAAAHRVAAIVGAQSAG